MPDLCTLTGLFTAPDGSPFAEARLILRPAQAQVSVTAAGRIIATVTPAAVETDEAGHVTLALAPGHYRGSATRADGASFAFDLAVPDLAAAPLQDYIGRIDVEVQTSAQLARDAALAARDLAQASAAAAAAAALSLGATAYALHGDLPGTAAPGARAYVYADSPDLCGLWFRDGGAWVRDALNPASQAALAALDLTARDGRLIALSADEGEMRTVAEIALDLAERARTGLLAAGASSRLDRLNALAAEDGDARTTASIGFSRLADAAATAYVSGGVAIPITRGRLISYPNRAVLIGAGRNNNNVAEQFYAGRIKAGCFGKGLTDTQVFGMEVAMTAFFAAVAGLTG